MANLHYVKGIPDGVRSCLVSLLPKIASEVLVDTMDIFSEKRDLLEIERAKLLIVSCYNVDRNIVFDGLW